MKTLVIITILVILDAWSGTNDTHPGIVGSIGLDFLNKIKNNYFSKLMAELNNVHIDDMNEGKLKMNSMNLNINIPSHDSLQISFDSQNDGLRLVIKNIHAKLQGKWKFKKGFIKIKGHLTIEGEFDEIGLTLGFTTQNKEGYQIPAVYTKSANVEINKHKWKGSFGHNVIQKVGNLILKIFRGKGVKSIRKNVLKQLNDKVPTLINREIKKALEIEAPLAPWLSMNIATVNPIKVTQDWLSVPLNGTIYIPGSSVNTTHKASEMKLQQTNAKEAVLMTISSYVFRTFADSLNQYDFEYDFVANNYDLNVFIPGENNSIIINNTDSGIHFVASGTCTMIQTGISFDIKISGDLSFNFTNGDDKYMFYMNPYVDKNSLDIKTSNVQLVRQRLGLGMLSPIFGPMIEFFAKKLELKPIPVKKVKDFPFVINHSSTEFNRSFMKIGLEV